VQEEVLGSLCYFIDSCSLSLSLSASSWCIFQVVVNTSLLSPVISTPSFSAAMMFLSDMEIQRKGMVMLMNLSMMHVSLNLHTRLTQQV
jgi:hypothetical protein